MEQLYDVKTQFVCGKAVLTDMTGDSIPGKAEGDHRKTLIEQSNVSQAVADIVLLAAAAANAKAVEASREMFALLEDQGVSKADVLKGLSLVMGEDVTDAEYAALQVRVFKHD